MEFTFSGLHDTPALREAFDRARDYFLTTGGAMSPERAEAIFDATALSTARYLYDCASENHHDLAVAALLTPLFGDRENAASITEDFGRQIAGLVQEMRGLNCRQGALNGATRNGRRYALAYATAALDMAMSPPIPGMAPDDAPGYAKEMEIAFASARGVDRELDQAFDLALTRARTDHPVPAPARPALNGGHFI